MLLTAPLLTALTVPLPALFGMLVRGDAYGAIAAYAIFALVAVMLSAFWFALAVPLICLGTSRWPRVTILVRSVLYGALASCLLYALITPPRELIDRSVWQIALGFTLPGAYFGLVAGFATVFCRRPDEEDG